MTEDQAEAHGALERALVYYLHCCARLKPGDVMTAWATVICLQNVENPTHVDYALALSGGVQPAHVTAGLMQAGSWCVDGTYELEGDDA